MNARWNSLQVAMVVCSIAATGPALAQQQERPSENRLHRFDRQLVTVPDFDATGWILDIGAGGEGIIGQVKGAQVVGIDLSERELSSAPAGPLKIVMDASDLKFLSGTFNTVTCFFTMMYIPAGNHEKVFAEVARVMAPGGRFLLWDPILPTQEDPQRDIVVVPLRITLPSTTVQTGYGVHFPPARQDVAYWTRLAERAGLKVLTSTVSGQTFFMELVKAPTPPSH